MRRSPDDKLRLNAICPYYTMFPLSFPQRELDEHPSVTSVLDPFCGRGTTLYAARLAGLPAVGIDVNPVAVAIAHAKLIRVTPAAVVRLAKQYLEGPPAEVPEGEFWRWCFHSRTLEEVAKLRLALLSAATPTAVMLRAIILGVLHGPRNKRLPSYLSNQMPRTYASKPAYAVRYWTTNNMEPLRVSALDVIERRAEYLLGDIPSQNSGSVYAGDAAETLRSLRHRFDLVVTSPPYYGMRTYVADQWLRSWFLGGPPQVPYGSQGQIARQPGQDAFASALGEVWAATAGRCVSGTRLVVRFGALPSARTDPEELLRTSLDKSGYWEVKEVRTAGVSPKKARQAEQFGRTGSAIDEIDLVAELSDTPIASAGS